MNSDELAPTYDSFFHKSKEGQYFINEVLVKTIEDLHIKAEKQPDQARDLIQRAAGVREILEHIDSVHIAASKGEPTE